MAGMINRALKGSPMATLPTTGFPRATRTVMYTEPTVNNQLTKVNQPEKAFAIATTGISATMVTNATIV